jgi:hypothetical protein
MNRFAPLIVGVLIFAAALGAHFFILSAIDARVGEASKAKAGVISLSQGDTYAQNVESFLAANAAAEDGIAAFTTTDVGIVGLIQEIDDAAKESHVSVSIDSVNVGAAAWNYHEPLTVSLSAKGPFQALVAFTTKLESLPDASRLISVHAEASEGKSWFETVKLEFLKTKPS